MGKKGRDGTIKHGMSKTRVHKIWRGMLARCRNHNEPEYKRYGGRGIRVCKRWMTFSNFYEDMGDPLTNKHSIDRKDNNGGYELGNCRWATTKEQGQNMRSNRIITWRGRTQTLQQWVDELQINRSTMYTRMSLGWSIDKIFTTTGDARRIDHGKD